ncbi:MAG: PP2C family serine/threonine-protein phosphatase [Ignavibacteriota bacterium]
MKDKKQLSISYFGATDIGLVRTENQDSFGKFPEDNTNMYQPKGVLFILADGMGGHTGGKEASQVAVRVVSREYFSFSSDVITSALLYAYKTANLKINQSSQDSPQFSKKGTTCSALVLENDKAHIAHVGDSKIYKITDGNIIQQTNDHTEVGEMLRKKILSEEEAKNHPSKSVLVRAMGIEADVEVDLIENISINSGDCFVLCSDGLGKVNTEEIKQIVLNNSEEDACKQLISLANERGGHDNVTVEVIKIVGEKTENILPYKPKTKESNNKWYLVLLLISIIILMAVLGLGYQREILNFFSAKHNNSIDSTLINENIIAPDVSETLFIDANRYLSEGKLDSAMVLYNLILNDNPLHVSALNGKEQVILKYIQNGNQLTIDHKVDEALLAYKMALALNPENKDLAIKIISIQKGGRNITTEVKKTTDNNNKQKVQITDQQISDSKSDAGSLTFSSMDLAEWDATGLSSEDYKYQDNKFVFLKTYKPKKLIYKQPMEDIDVSCELRIDGSANHKAGIIVGYNRLENEGNENYYLFAVDNSGNYKLLNFQNGNEDVLVSGRNQIDINKKVFNLKIKCLGPWIMLYNDNKLLKSYFNDGFVKGRIGLFSDSNLQVEFDNLTIGSAFEENKN